MASKQIKCGRSCYYDPLTHIWTGLPTPPLYNTQQSIGQLILTMLQRSDPMHVTQINADIDQGRKVTCREMYLRTVRIAEHLARLGYGKDTPMAALASRNGEHVAPVMFACFALGIPINTLDVAFSVADFAHMFSVTRPVLVFCESDVLGVVRDAARRASIEPEYVLFEDTVEGYRHVRELLEPTGTEDTFEPTLLDDPSTHLAVVLCSSGTTGLSKGVSYSHTFCIANLPSLWLMAPTDCLLAFSSLYWLSGFASLIIGTIAQASRVITREPYTTQLAIDIMQKHRVTIAFFSPYQSNLLVNEPQLANANLPGLRLLLCGGARVSKHLYASLRRCMPSHTLIQIGYGMSECCLISLTDGHSYRDDCVGTLQARASARIVDEQTGQRGLPPGEPGEILLRVMVPFSGYYGNEAATAEMMGPDGWIRTGDIGYIDTDGHLYVIDRKKDIIKYAGNQISPTELEALIKQLPGVLECSVVGLPAEGTDLPAALIIRAPGTVGDSVTADQVQQFVEGQVSNYKRLRGGVFFTDELPLTPSGKIIRRKCLELVQSMLKGE
ncbi:4-coumarate--CoA ligase-like 5 [Anopheles stephensi]|uniref:AMP-dependent synthetase/ligase domain-containing protein n=1 Tax=Anopheles stephensi TaxID=30069 RepID=A0A182Y4W2_ANOST|nr:4-coumarate--CoA ligase-like 5 [Anopheles stephensi]